MTLLGRRRAQHQTQQAAHRADLGRGGDCNAVLHLLRTVVWSWTSASEFSAKDRIATRHKVSFVMTLPKRYAEEIARIPA